MALNLNRQAGIHQLFLIIVISVVIFFLFYRHMIQPLGQEIESKRDQVLLKEKEKETLTRFSASTPLLNKRESLIHNKPVKMKVLEGEVLPTFTNLSLFVSEMTQQDFLKGMRILNLKYSDEVIKTGYASQGFEVLIEGDFLQVMSYLEKLEQFPALFVIERVKIISVNTLNKVLSLEVAGVFFRMDQSTLNFVEQKVVEENDEKKKKKRKKKNENESKSK